MTVTFILWGRVKLIDDDYIVHTRKQEKRNLTS